MLLADGPCAVVRRVNEIDLFVRWDDDTLRTITWKLDWGVWSAFSDGSKTYSAPSATSTEDEGIRLCVQGASGNLCRAWHSGFWER